jgi:hypothetical protein
MTIDVTSYFGRIEKNFNRVFKIRKNLISYLPIGIWSRNFTERYVFFRNIGEGACQGDA